MPLPGPASTTNGAAPASSAPAVVVEHGYYQIPLVPADSAFQTGYPAGTPSWATVDQVERLTTKRGRAYEEDEVQAGELDVTVDVRGQNGTTSWVPGRDARAVVDLPLRVRVTPPAPYNGTTYTVHTGTVDTWTQDLMGGFDYATSTAIAYDALAAMAVQPLVTNLGQEILADLPRAYWPLTDPAPPNGSTVVPDLEQLVTNGVAPARLIHLQDGGAGDSWSLGNASLVDEGSSLLLSPSYDATGLQTGSWAVDLAPQSGREPWFFAAQAFSVECVLAGFVTNPGTTFLVQQQNTNGADQQRPVWSLQSNGTGAFTSLEFKAGIRSTGQALTATFTTRATRDTAPHQVMGTLSADLKTASLYLDGQLVAQATDPNGQPVSWPGTPVHLTAGSIRGGVPLSYGGRLGHIAMHPTTLTPARVATRWAAVAGFPGEGTPARVTRVASYAPTLARTGVVSETGRTRNGRCAMLGKSAFAVLESTAAAERGVLFAAGNGTLTLHGRAHRENAPSLVILHADPALGVEADISPQLDRARIENDVTIGRVDGPVQRAVWGSSVTRHGRRSGNPMTLDVLTDAEANDAAWERAGRLGEPRVRVAQVTLDPFTLPALWPWALGLEIGDRITLAGLGPTFPFDSGDFFVESIAHATDPEQWKTTFQLSPAGLQDFFVIEDTEWGFLGDGTSTTADAYPLAA